jgi:hypothetical protein
MKIKHFYIGLSSNDYIPKSHIETSKETIVSDFNFQTDYITQFIDKHLRTLKYDADDFNMIFIRGRKNPKEHFFIEELHKCLTIEIPFDEKLYNDLYPFQNEYPLTNLLKPLENQKGFNEFIKHFIIRGLNKAKKQKAPIPTDQLIKSMVNLKDIDYKNEWIHKSKTFKEFGLKASLSCELTCNYFLLTLIIEKDNQEIFNQELLKSLPNSTIYKDEFNDLIIEGRTLKILKKDKSILAEVELEKIKKGANYIYIYIYSS